MNMQGEIWEKCDSIGFENYAVSNLGRVKTLNYKRSGKEKILKFHDRNGYYIVRFSLNGKSHIFSVHRLVLMIFNPIENYENLQVDHLNTIKTDNRLENLHWCTRRENLNNPITLFHLSERMKGQNNPMSKTNREKRLKIKNECK